MEIDKRVSCLDVESLTFVDSRKEMRWIVTRAEVESGRERDEESSRIHWKGGRANY